MTGEPRWAAEIGYSNEQLGELNRKAIALMEELRDEYESPDTPVVISSCIGPQNDGYNPAEILSASAAQGYHSTQIGTFALLAAKLPRLNILGGAAAPTTGTFARRARPGPRIQTPDPERNTPWASTYTPMNWTSGRSRSARARTSC